MNHEQYTRAGDRADAMADEGKDGCLGTQSSTTGGAGEASHMSDRSQTRLHRSIRFVVKGLPAVCFCQLL